MIILIGKSGSGKSSVFNELIRRGYERILVETTRKPRELEFNGLDYNFVSQPVFTLDKLTHKFICDSTFTLADGTVVKYGLPVPNDRQIQNGVCIINPHWLHEAVQYADEHQIPYMVAHLVTPDKDLRSRLLMRGDNAGEILRRMNADDEDFAKIETELSKYPSFTNGNGSLQHTVAKIISEYELSVCRGLKES